MKDLRDIEHDIANDIETPIVIISQSKNGPLKSHVEALFRYYGERSKGLPPGKAGPAEAKIIDNLQQLIGSTIQEIENHFHAI